ncbi:ubiquitinyl hydrolase [Cryphonectria parasitica EP155]|uniref:Ubiquitin carboxyl-terminal hydrolase n=1 Tax=Cryphonectria parasitica (strain ATCC 38755 / EP155) TaxID=660469 RepID=A0A9P5CVF2_CRYP1|nr:ubiquitinyl hydrolase [Cryphonectria parasitica EP155]KAF3770660.1 ubiquitinyl hydrolase [Cryphonectria parasitica EP155]
MSGGWNTIESDAGVFTFLLENLGVKDVQFEELISMDPEALAQLHPVYGVIFLFKYPTDTPYTSAEKPLEGTFDHDAAVNLWFANQTIQNACGTQAVLSVLMNKQNKQSPEGPEAGYIDVGEPLREFHDFTESLPAEFRGEALSNSVLIRDVHNAFAKSQPFVDETQRQIGEPEDVYHFIAYTPIGGTLYEMDGLQPAPISHGPCTQEQFPAIVMDVLQRRINRYDTAEIRFNLLAMVRDLRIRANEIGDAELLEREGQKRWDWQFENALRRTNLIGFVGEVLKGVVADKLKTGGEDAYQKWVDAGHSKMKQRIDTKKKKTGMAEDVEMGG